MNSYTTEGPQTLFRVFVEDIGKRDELRAIVGKHFPDGAAIQYGEGLWQGEREQNAVVEVYGREAQRGEITVMAHELREAFQQQSVLVAEHSDRVSFYLV